MRSIRLSKSLTCIYIYITNPYEFYFYLNITLLSPFPQKSQKKTKSEVEKQPTQKAVES